MFSSGDSCKSALCLLHKASHNNWTGCVFYTERVPVWWSTCQEHFLMVQDWDFHREGQKCSSWHNISGLSETTSFALMLAKSSVIYHRPGIWEHNPVGTVDSTSIFQRFSTSNKTRWNIDVDSTLNRRRTSKYNFVFNASFFDVEIARWEWCRRLYQRV